MMKDYKGEMPKNVTTPEKAKAKKPFYKDWKFWVLTGLMTLFGACSIYGLVLGSQYVKAIERASHIIADAQSDASSLGKKPNYMPTPAGYDDDFSFNFVLYEPTAGFHLLKLIDGSDAPASPAYPALSTTYTANQNTYFYLYLSGRMICISDYCTDVVLNNCAYVPNGESGFGYFRHDVNGAWPMTITGNFHFKPYASGYSAGESDGYSDGYQEGYSEGHSDGYDEGFQDGADSQANEQTIKVLLAPDFTGDRIQYTHTLDGAEVGTGYLSNTNQHYQNQVQFSRPAGGQHKAVLNLYSDNDEPIKIAYDTFTGTLGETRYLWYQKSNAYDWSTSQWYVPTYWAEARFLVTGYGTYDQGFTEDYFFNLDPQYNDRAKVGAYSEGYDAGYNDAVESGDAYDAGYDAGKEDGYREGDTDGFNRGVAVGSSGSQSLALMFKTAFQLPFDQLYRFLNFNLLGINFLSLFTALISVSIGIMVIKKVL